MALMTNDMSAADIAAVCGNNRGGDGFGWGGDGIWFLILFLALIGNGGWGNNGGFGGNGGNGFVPNYLFATNTDANVNSRFDTLGITGQLNGIQSAITNGFSSAEVAACNRAQNDLERSFASQTAITTGLTGIQSQLATCCCENRLATANLSADIAREACATRTADAQNTQTLLTTINGGIQAIKDQLCQDKIDAKNDEISQLRQEVLYARGQASQIAQNSTIIDGIYNRLNQCPVGTVPVYGEQPIFTCPNNSGCGCGGNTFFN